MHVDITDVNVQVYACMFVPVSACAYIHVCLRVHDCMTFTRQMEHLVHQIQSTMFSATEKCQ